MTHRITMNTLWIIATVFLLASMVLGIYQLLALSIGAFVVAAIAFALCFVDWQTILAKSEQE